MSDLINIRRSLPDEPATYQIHIFRTNIDSTEKVSAIASVLSGDTRIIRWNVDYSDVDHVLRIESLKIKTIQLIQIINSLGYSCEELPD